jgi:hypothetical protein
MIRKLDKELKYIYYLQNIHLIHIFFYMYSILNMTDILLSEV